MDFIKIVLVGNDGVGKSNLLSRFMYNDFSSESRKPKSVDCHDPCHEPIIDMHLGL